MNADSESLSLLLLKARESSIAHLRPILVEFGLTEQQWRVIRVLSRFSSLSAHDLAEESCILSPSLSRILVRLETDNVITRKTDNVDQRALNIKLTAKGKRLHNKIEPLIERQYQKLSKNLGQDTIVNLMGILQEFNAVGERAASSQNNSR